MPYTATLEAVDTHLRSRSLPVPPDRTYVLTRNIPAIQIVPEGEQNRLGLITQLPRFSELEACGSGFDPETIKVRCNGILYFVFLQDLEPVRKLAAIAGR
ncbi:MAG TPA: hypothetical protein VFB14_24900 [Bryobacteraceae bacterium]|jgi:hypothetical protein|nr:hypothetical protein [Bryobacteraceae bacterium]